ncbi:PREDICTED: succinate dehydrogenase subunit 4, mitochondrial [Camelina sativa]|uniref:Succinate dehydrogenase subunit 4, mitochondrial n=1 Tax=Camelina sativa TaxID=90675 RepID=A0ABM0YVX9_CAMSA|nr:PREDICTED: succinate dehydrogenase subunit 4, mitochondrial [Camelina sativa]
MSLRRTILDLHRQSHKASLSKSFPFSMSQISSASATTAVRNPLGMGRDLSSIPFALAQKLKPDSTNLVTDRSISSSIRQSNLNNAAKFSRLSSSRGYTNASFLPKIHLLYHINEGMEEILADYVHQEMTRHLMVISLGLFQFIVIKDIFVFLF